MEEPDKYQKGGMMEKRTKSILDEIFATSTNTVDPMLLLETKGSHVITSCIRLLEMVEAHFDAEEADKIQRRMLLAIKNRNVGNFTNTCRQLKYTRKKP